ncbi:MAG: serine/threonine protein kinase [Chthonomonadales bacterium]|nr:serine/threonine protein kinase [Chthonomonadales bacterium]
MPSHPDTTAAVQSPPSPQRTRRLLALLAVLLLVAAAAGAFRLSAHLNERALASASLTDLQKMQTNQQNDERVLFYLAQRQEQSGQLKEAMESYNKALQADQDDEAAWFGFARTTNAVVGSVHAREVVQTWLVRNPRSAGAYEMQARLDQREGNHLSAYDTAVKAAALAPKNGDIWLLMGAEAMELERPADAETAFRHAIECKPKDWHNYVGLGNAQVLLGHHPESLAGFRAAVRLAPELGVPHLLLGTELLNTAAADADIETARAELLQSAQKTNTMPKNAQIQMATLLGESYKRQHRWKEALGWYQQAEQGNPLDPTVQYSLIAVYQGLGDKVASGRAEARHREIEAYDQELKVTNSHILAAPDDREARLKLARLYRSHGAKAEAARTYQEWLSRSPNDTVAQQELQDLLATTPTATP